MKQLLLICAVVMGQSVLAADKKPLTKEESAKVIEKAIRKAAKKPTGELTQADLEKVKGLNLHYKNLTSVKGLEKLTQLTHLRLDNNKLTNVKGLEKLTQLRVLNIRGNQLTNVKGLEKLTQLRSLSLRNNPELTKAQIAELQKALPKCRIWSDATK
jgi:Leucine-rich repeat (LRR) protein